MLGISKKKAVVITVIGIMLFVMFFGGSFTTPTLDPGNTLGLEIKKHYTDNTVSTVIPQSIANPLSWIGQALATVSEGGKQVYKIAVTVNLYLEYNENRIVNTADFVGDINILCDNNVKKTVSLGFTDTPSVSGETHQIGFIEVYASEVVTWSAGAMGDHELKFQVPEGATLQVLFEDGYYDTVSFTSTSASVNVLVSEEAGITVATINFGSNGISKFMLNVNGQNFIDGESNTVYLKGISLWDSDVFEDWRTYLSVEEFARIRAWGFNTINIPVNWMRVEPYLGSPGVYDEENLLDIDDIIETCANNDLYVIISIRQYNNWFGEPPNPESIAYAMTQEAVDRCQNLIEMLSRRFKGYDNVIGYNGLFFPFHGYDPIWYNAEWESFYYNTWTPMLINTIRTYTNKIVFWSPVYQGGESEGEADCDTGQFGKIAPFADGNIVYCHRFHRGRSTTGRHNGVEHGEEWDYDTAFVDYQLSYGSAFRNAYNVPVMPIEFGLLTQNTPVTPSRADCLEYKFLLMKNSGIENWVYWQYGNGEEIINGAHSSLNEAGIVVYKALQGEI